MRSGRGWLLFIVLTTAFFAAIGIGFFAAQLRPAGRGKEQAMKIIQSVTIRIEVPTITAETPMDSVSAIHELLRNAYLELIRQAAFVIGLLGICPILRREILCGTWT